MLSYGAATHAEPNRRQELALERVESAVGELASVLLSNCRSNELAKSVIQEVRDAVEPIVVDILTID